MKPIVIIDKYEPEWLSIEDSGSNLSYELEGGPDENFFVRLHSSDIRQHHKTMIDLINEAVHENKKIKVTIELIN